MNLSSLKGGVFKEMMEHKWCRSSHQSDTYTSSKVYSIIGQSLAYIVKYFIEIVLLIQIRSYAVATLLRSFETISISFQPFEMGCAPTTVHFHLYISRTWILHPLPNALELEISGQIVPITYIYIIEIE